jgi:pimeloyl-ACP methyl ester carboxylesterase
VPALALAVLGGGAAWAILPVLPAIRFLKALAGAEPSKEWAHSRASYEPVVRQFHDAGPEALVDVPGPAWLRSGTETGSSGVIFVHGLTESGLDDPRVWRLAVALEEAGFLWQVPRIDGFVDVRRNAGVVAGDPRLESAFRSQSRPFGVLAVSVGAGPALRAAARAFREGHTGPAAIFLVGAPDDVVTLSRAWFAVPDAPPDAPTDDGRVAEAGRFSRRALARAALDDLVPTLDRVLLLQWLEDPPAYRLPPFDRPGGLSPAARRFVTAVGAGPAISAADRDWILAAIEPFLAALSPARFDAELDALRCPVFLIHGVDDPLVPAGQMERLRARLARRVRVEALESTVLSHVGVEDASLSEKWRHVRFVQRFFDAVSRSR